MRRTIKWQKGEEMERLTNRKYGENSCAGVTIPYSTYCIGCITSGCNCGIVEDMVKKLADYENLEEQGRMIVFPCNKGDKIYEFYRGEDVEGRLEAGESPKDIINDRKVYGFEYMDDELYIRASYHSSNSEFYGGPAVDSPEFPVSEIGKTVFLTYEEAEAKLKEMRG